MKRILLTLLFVFAIGSFNQAMADNCVETIKEEVVVVDDCFDFAIDATVQGGEMTEDEETEALNTWFAFCWCLTGPTDSQACTDFFTDNQP